MQQFQKTKNFSSISLEIEEKLNKFLIISSLTQNYSLINIQSVHEKCIFLNTVGIANLSEFFSAPYRTVSYRNRPSIVLENSAKSTKTPFFIKTFGVFNAKFSDNAKRTVKKKI
jgi:hypothetical protein